MPGEHLRTGTALSEVEALLARIHDLRVQDTEAADRVDARVARLAALFRNLPLLPAQGTVRDALVRFRDAGYLTRQTADVVALILELDTLPQDELDLRRLLHRAGRALAHRLLCPGSADGRARGGLDRWRAVLPRLADLARREAESSSIRRAWSPARTCRLSSEFRRGRRSAGRSTRSARPRWRGGCGRARRRWSW